MEQGVPYPQREAVFNIVIAILLTLVTCGIYMLYWQYKQMETLNAWLDRNEYSFILWLLLSLITCGIFGIYYEYKMARGINEVQERYGFRVNGDLPIICVLLAILSIGVVSLAIQQHEINSFYGRTAEF